jgi:hypothetical protein
MKTRNTITKGGRFDGADRGGSAGLTVTEVCCALAALALLMMVALPALGMSKGRSHRIVCVNNLSRIGLANAMWANEHEGRRPLMTPYWQGGVQTSGNISPPVPTAGTPAFPWGSLNNQPWFHYFWLSNELVTPKLLVCPSERSPGKRPAVDWSASPTSGLLHPNFRGNSVSYVVGHSTSDYERGLISADRNLPVIGNNASCGYGYFGINPTSATGAEGEFWYLILVGF